MAGLMRAEFTISTETDLIERQRTASEELAAPRLAGYDVVELIGEGSYGDVWKAVETATGTTVAIKRLRRQPDSISEDDAEKLAKLGAARGIVALRMVHLHEPPYCYVMEYLPGGSLADLLREGPLPPADAWRIFCQLTDALAYVHKETIIHCDLKPANVLLDARGNPRIADFGQARRAGAKGFTLGTRFYMPPEQVRDVQHDPRWDVYALGAIFYEMLTGEKPRYDEGIASRLSTPTPSGSDARKLLEEYARHIEDAPPPSAHRAIKQVDASVADLIDQCLSIQYDERPKEAAAVLKLVERCEHTRRSRPLLIFGGLAPAIMLSLLGVLFFVAGWIMLRELERSWIDHVLDSNSAIAEAIGGSTGSRFNEQMRTVQKVAGEPRWRDLLSHAGVPAEQALQELKALYPRYTDFISRWMLANSSGEMIANFGELVDKNKSLGVDEATNGQNFAWRGWFNGIEDRQKRLGGADEGDLQAFQNRPSDKAFVAQPYMKVGDNNFLALTISCPVVAVEDPPAGRPDAKIGVIAGSIDYQDFLRLVEDFVVSQSIQQRNVVIVNDRMQVIYHPRVLEDANRRAEMFAIKKFEDCEHFQKAFNGETKLGVYKDPLDGRNYIGACRLQELENAQSLAIIVQQDYGTALDRVHGFKSVVQWLAAALFSVGIVFLGMNSYALYWTLRQNRESSFHG